MKFVFALFALAFQTSAILGAAAPIPNVATDAAYAALVEECGSLGVMKVPEGADPANYRKCAEHPLGENRRLYDTSYEAPDASLFKRGWQVRGAADLFARAEQKCEYASGLGCSGNYCWRACGTPGDGKWCWTAAGDGGGKWLQCATYKDCDRNAACGKGCVVSKACGCGC